MSDLQSVVREMQEKLLSTGAFRFETSGTGMPGMRYGGERARHRWCTADLVTKSSWFRSEALAVMDCASYLYARAGQVPLEVRNEVLRGCEEAMKLLEELAVQEGDGELARNADALLATMAIYPVQVSGAVGRTLKCRVALMRSAANPKKNVAVTVCEEDFARTAGTPGFRRWLSGVIEYEGEG